VANSGYGFILPSPPYPFPVKSTLGSTSVPLYRRDISPEKLPQIDRSIDRSSDSTLDKQDYLDAVVCTGPARGFVYCCLCSHVSLSLALQQRCLPIPKVKINTHPFVSSPM